MVRFLIVFALFAAAAHAADRPDRAEIFEHLHAPAAPSATSTPATLPEVHHDVTITGKLAPGLRLDLELQYLSTNKFRDVIVGGVGRVREPLPKMLRPGVTYREDGTYEIKFSLHTASWLAGKFQLSYARIGVLSRDAQPTWFDLRQDRAAAPAMADCQRISVIQIGGALSADVVTSAGSAPHRVLRLPTEAGSSSYTWDVTRD